MRDPIFLFSRLAKEEYLQHKMNAPGCAWCLHLRFSVGKPSVIQCDCAAPTLSALQGLHPGWLLKGTLNSGLTD